MGRLSEKITRYVIDAGAVSEELYAVYQYGFQIGLEMLICLFVCMSIADILAYNPRIPCVYRCFYVFKNLCWWCTSE